MRLRGETGSKRGVAAGAGKEPRCGYDGAAMIAAWLRRESKQAGYGCCGCDACCRQQSREPDAGFSGCVVGAQGEGSGVCVAPAVEGDVLDDLDAALGVSDAGGCVGWVIPGPGDVIEQVLAGSGVGPDAEAEVAVLRGARGVHDFRSIAVPDDHGVVDDRGGNRLPVHGMGLEDDMPHADDGVERLVVLEGDGLEHARLILEMPCHRFGGSGGSSASGLGAGGGEKKEESGEGQQKAVRASLDQGDFRRAQRRRRRVHSQCSHDVAPFGISQARESKLSLEGISPAPGPAREMRGSV